MGFNTTVLILNDRLSDIEKDPEKFVKELSLMAGGGRAQGPAPHDFHAASQSGIIETHHADQTSVILVGGNTATVLGFARGYRHGEAHNQVRILEEMLHKYGYDIRRQPLKKLEGALFLAKRVLESARAAEKYAYTVQEHFVWRQRLRQAEGRVDWLLDKIEDAKRAKK